MSDKDSISKDYEWYQSSFCASGACVEVAVSEFGDVLVSDSKRGDASPFRGFSSDAWARVLEDIRDGCLPDGVTLPTYGTVAWGVLQFTNEEWDAFVAGVKAGEFDYDKLSSGEAGSGFRGVARSGQAATGAGDGGATSGVPAPVADQPQTAPVAAHYQTAGWAGGPGECGAVCACGIEFDNFDTIAEAAALLDGHIADEIRAAALSEISDELVELVAQVEYAFDGQDVPEDIDIPWNGADPALKNFFVRRAKMALEVAVPLLRKRWENEVEPAWGSGPLVKHVTETPGQAVQS